MRRNGSPCRIMSKTRAEPLTEGVEAIPFESRSDAATPRGSPNPSIPSGAPPDLRPYDPNRAIFRS